MRRLILSGLAVAAILAVQPSTAQARFNGPVALSAAPLAEPVACRTVKTRTRVGGRVVVKTVRRCSPRPVVQYRARRCVNERIRVRTPAGALVFKTVRRCR
jgi:hypothetical protein